MPMKKMITLSLIGLLIPLLYVSAQEIVPFNGLVIDAEGNVFETRVGAMAKEDILKVFESM